MKLITQLKTKRIHIMPCWRIPLFILGIELLFHLEIYGCFDIYMLYAALFALPFSFFVLLLSGTKNPKWNLVVRSISLLVVTIYYVIQIIYHQVFGNFLSLKSIVNGAGQAMDFGYTIWEAFCEHVLVIGIAVAAWILYTVLDIRKLTSIDVQQESQDAIQEEVHMEPNVMQEETLKESNAIQEKLLTESNTIQEETQTEPNVIGKKASSYKNWKQIGICLAAIVILPFAGTVFLMMEGTGIGSTYDVKMHFHRTEQSMYRLGLLETLKKDVAENLCDKLGITEKQVNMCYLWIENAFFEESVDNFATKEPFVDNETAINNGVDDSTIEDAGMSKTTLANSTNEHRKSERIYHIWDIDFQRLMEETDSDELKEVHDYFASQEPTVQNQYTGLFKGYNLIYITAESFSDVVIDKERTPTLYQMQQEGFQFENFYTPSWYLSTIDGEYVNCLGQIPVEGDWSLQHSSKNALSMALGNQLQKQGYVCNAYHNHDSYYYDRTVTHPKLGYEFKAVGAGLTFESMYPESDLELMEITVDEYIGKESFHTYYMTMSGHLPYTYDYNSMAVKNQEVVEGEGWSENAACYLAANTELEYAVAYLVEQLEEAGQLENTLFVIAPDHYPYGLKKGAYDELRGYEVESDEFEVYRNGCLIWSASMKEMEEVSFPVKVEKYCSNLDLLPTISNLMGLSFDSRLLAGRDMLSEDMGLVMFKDQSFLTDKVRYYATTGEVEWAAGEEEDSAYLEYCMELVQNRFYYSAKVLELDYLNIVKD